MTNRLNDASAIEARLLELAHTTDAKLTAPALAYFAPCSIENAQRVLDELTTRNQLSMDVEDDGTIVYRMFGRQKLAPGVAAPRVPRLERQALVPAELHRYRAASPLLAALLTVFIPGAGHLYAGRFLSAIMWFLLVGAGYALIVPGLILHLFSIASAANAAHQLNAAPSQRLLVAGY